MHEKSEEHRRLDWQSNEKITQLQQELLIQEEQLQECQRTLTAEKRLATDAAQRQQQTIQHLRVASADLSEELLKARQSISALDHQIEELQTVENHHTHEIEQLRNELASAKQQQQETTAALQQQLADKEGAISELQHLQSVETEENHRLLATAQQEYEGLDREVESLRQQLGLFADREAHLWSEMQRLLTALGVADALADARGVDLAQGLVAIQKQCAVLMTAHLDTKAKYEEGQAERQQVMYSNSLSIPLFPHPNNKQRHGANVAHAHACHGSCSRHTPQSWKSC